MSASLSFVFANTELLQSRGTRQIRMFAPSAAMHTARLVARRAGESGAAGQAAARSALDNRTPTRFMTQVTAGILAVYAAPEQLFSCTDEPLLESATSLVGCWHGIVSACSGHQ